MNISDVSGISSFEVGTDRSTCGFRWTRWFRSFELYADGKGVTNHAQRKALLLHSAGLEVQDIFFTLTCPDPVEGEDVYSVCSRVLADYFTPRVNVAFERSKFRGLAQNADESVEAYVTRLRQRAVYCNFADVEESIRDQLIEKCVSQRLRRKLLERDNPTLEQCLQVAQSLETSESQAHSMSETVNKVQYNSRKQVKNDTKGGATFNDRARMCYACGRIGHIRTDKSCPARGKKCRKCNKEGHFEKCCKSTGKSFKAGRSKFRKDKVRTVEADDSDESDQDDDYVFSLNNQKSGDIQVNIGGIDVPVIIDSGASCNVIDRELWESLKQADIKCKSYLTSKRVYAYGQEKPLTIAGGFSTTVRAGSKMASTEFLVIEEKGKALLCKQTSMDLGILCINKPLNHEVYNVHMDSTSILKEFPECFEGIGKLKDYQLHIPVDNTVQPVVQGLRRVPYNLREKLDKKLDELESLDIIEKVEGTSRWISPIVVVPKSNNDVRLCVDMRRANEAVCRVRYPIPTTEEILQDLNKSTVFSKLDIRMAYHQIELDDESREITTFMTHRGTYRYKRLLFGVSCAPEMYNKVIAQVLSDLEGVNSIFDDIICHGQTEEEHDMRLRALLSRLQEKGLTLNIEKCQFKMESIEFMGHKLSNKGVEITESKIYAVLNARRPQNSSEVKSFLGLVNFSARFISNMATIAEPLRRLTRKNEQFVWGIEQEESFQKLKESLSNARSLGYYNRHHKTQVVCDAGPVGIGCVLVQENKGEQRVIMYASRALTDIERRYSQTEKEALAIVWACERLHMYLVGTEFELLTDHKPLQFIFSPKSKPCARVERWVLRLQSYRYTVKHIPGCTNIADSLSRLLPENPVSESSIDFLHTEEYVHCVASEATPVAMTTEMIEKASRSDNELKELREILTSGRWHEMSNASKSYLPIRHELSTLGFLVLRGTRIVMPGELRNHVLQLGHEGHPGIVLMKQRLRSKVWWPGMDKDIEQFCKSCYGCQLVTQGDKPEPMIRREMPTKPWEHLCADFLGPLPSGDNLFVIVDYYSRWKEIFIVKTITSGKVIECLKSVFAVHGLPLSLQTDNAQYFNSEELNTFLRNLNIEHRNTTPLWPQANGEVEIQNKGIMKRIRIAHAENRSWKEDLQIYLLMYRSTPHSTTGVSPAELLFKRKLRTKLPEIYDYSSPEYEIRDRDSERKGKGKMYGDQRRNARESGIQEGDVVLVKQKKQNKLSTAFNPNPMSVVGRNGNSVVVESKDGARYSRNVSHVKRFQQKNLVESKELDGEIPLEITDTVSKTPVKSNNLPMESIPNSPECDELVRPRGLREKKLPIKFQDYIMS